MTEMEGRALQVSRTLADSLNGARLDETLAALTRAAVRTLPGVDQSSITIRHEDGSMASYAMTADFLDELDIIQYREQEGPCYDGAIHNAFTVCGDINHSS